MLSFCLNLCIIDILKLKGGGGGVLAGVGKSPCLALATCAGSSWSVGQPRQRIWRGQKNQGRNQPTRTAGLLRTGGRCGRRHAPLLPREGQEHLGGHDLGDPRGYRGQGVNSQLRLRSLRCLVLDMADVAHLLASRVVQVDNLTGNLNRLGHEGRERERERERE